jgi:hypothetical protein
MQKEFTSHNPSKKESAPRMRQGKRFLRISGFAISGGDCLYLYWYQ